MGRGDARAITRAWPPTATSIADVFTDTPLTGNQLAVFTDARGHRRRDRCRRSRSRSASRRRSSCFPPSAEERRGSASSPRATSCRSPVTRRSARRSCSARRCSAAVIELETGRGIVPVDARAGRVGEDRLRPHDAAGTGASSPSTMPAPLLAALGVERSSCRSSCTTTGHGTSSSASATTLSSARVRPDATALARLGVTGVNCFAGPERGLAEPHVLGERRGSPRRARRPARSRATWRATGGSPGARRS